ncbi:MAG: DNA recombination protein RmuC [Ruminococcaceae bacterium]|nr:DNA recombination protein RmuC [Oscillospiraceae bacterium]
MDIVLIIMGAVIIGLLLVLLFKKSKDGGTVDKNEIKSAVNEGINNMSTLLLSNIENTNKLFSTSVNEKIGELKAEMKELNENNTKGYVDFIEKLNSALGELTKAVREENEKAILNLNTKFDEFSKVMKERLDTIDGNVSKSLVELRRENTEKLGEIQKAVDEKLQKALDERLKTSFESVVSQIGNVNKAIGEIKNIAQDVGSLKNVLTNVKTKGIVGEVILGNIISEILTHDQYEENFATKKGSRDVVEFAIKMPAGEDGGFVYLPIDSKFPLETYYKIKDGIDTGNKEEIDLARKELRSKLRTYAKDIATKYISVPDTTDFAIMFLPIEGLYIEAIEGGLFEEFQRDFKVNIVGPSTLAALLNALRSGFNSLAIQKRSNEVFKLLEAVKSEFESFAKVLTSAQTRADQLSDELERLVGTRTRQMQRKLKDISVISLEEAKQIIDEE